MHLQRLKAQGTAMVIASHEPEMMDAIADRILHIQDGAAREQQVEHVKPVSAEMRITFEAKHEGWKSKLSVYELLHQEDTIVDILVKSLYSNLCLRQLMDCDCQIIEVRKEERECRFPL